MDQLRDTLIDEGVYSAVIKSSCEIGELLGDCAPNMAGFKKRVKRFVLLLQSALFPWTEEDVAPEHTAPSVLLHQAALLLNGILQQLGESGTEKTVKSFLESLPEVARLIGSDIQAAYEGDPAARSNEEIVLAYPCFEAIPIYRLAHVLYTLGVPLVPRVMTEYAHRITGIDIHPGATIGSHFFIDHGTGVVIGETTTIGSHVKLYQGVTLGAKSFALDENNLPVKGIKRHPDIGNNVVIYAGATILGGRTVIGDNCTIGGNVWLTHSVEAGSMVYLSDCDRNCRIRPLN